MPLKVVDVILYVGLVDTTSPPNVDALKLSDVDVPVKGKFIGAEPNCVNAPKYKNPALNPAPPTEIVFPEAQVGVPVPLTYPK